MTILRMFKGGGAGRILCTIVLMSFELLTFASSEIIKLAGHYMTCFKNNPFKYNESFV